MLNSRVGEAKVLNQGRFIFSRMLNLAVFCLLGQSVWAGMLKLPASVMEDVLSETDPTALAPHSFTTSDYSFIWKTTPLANAKVKLQEGTLQWVRVQEVLVLPRARARIEIQ